MSRVVSFLRLSIVAVSIALSASASNALAAERDGAFLDRVAGSWTGPGEIVAGKYKGTRFVCTLTGESKTGALGMSVDGDCRVGVFTQKMSASFEHDGRQFRGKFLDGSVGKGMDIVSGNVVDSSKVVLGLNRKQLDGILQARIPDANTMNVTISVNVEDRLVPVIGINLKRVDATAVGSISPN